MKKTFIVGLALAGLFILTGFSSCSQSGGTPSNSANNPASNSTGTPGQTSAPSGEASTVNIQNFSFNPSLLTIKKGMTITWTNNDSAPHQIKSATFNSSSLSQGQNFSFTFNNAGIFDYSCAIHPSMQGKVIVE